MRPRLIRVILLASALLIAACACPWEASCTSNTTFAAAPAIDETLVFQAIRDSVTGLQTALHRKVASVLTGKVAEKVAGASYDSTWQVTVKYWLNYSRPDDVPYLKGMQKCLAECSPTAGKEWVTWAETQIGLRRSAYADEIAFQQELQLRVAVTAPLDESGRLVSSSMKVLHVVSESEMLTFSAETLAAPSDSQMQQAGYYFLKDRLSPASSTEPSTGAASESPKTSSPSKGQGSSTRAVALPSPSGNSGTDRPQAILQIGIGGLVVLVLLLVLNQYLLKRRKR